MPYPAGRTTGEPSSRSLRGDTHSTSQKLRNAGPSIAVMPLTNISADGVLSEKIYRQGTFQTDPRLAELLQRMGLEITPRAKDQAE